MHPSGCGYAVLAAEAMRLLGLTPSGDNMLRRAFAEDGRMRERPSTKA